MCPYFKRQVESDDLAKARERKGSVCPTRGVLVPPVSISSENTGAGTAASSFMDPFRQQDVEGWGKYAEPRMRGFSRPFRRNLIHAPWLGGLTVSYLL